MIIFNWLPYKMHGIELEKKTKTDTSKHTKKTNMHNRVLRISELILYRVVFHLIKSPWIWTVHVFLSSIFYMFCSNYFHIYYTGSKGKHNFDFWSIREKNRKQKDWIRKKNRKKFPVNRVNGEIHWIVIKILTTQSSTKAFLQHATFSLS